MLALTLSVYVVVAIYSTVFAYRRLHRPGVSKEVRQMFVKKHFLYVVVFIGIWTIQQMQNYYELFNPTPTRVPQPENAREELIRNAKINIESSHFLEQLGYQLGLRDHILYKHGLTWEDVFVSVDKEGDDSNSFGAREFFTFMSGIMTFSTGIFLTIARLYEPLFRMLMLQSIY